MDAVEVHVASMAPGLAPAPPKQLTRPFTASGVRTDGTQTVVTAHRLLGRSPNRKQAVITIAGPLNDAVYIAGSASEAKLLSGAPVFCSSFATTVLDLATTDELYVGIPATAIVVIGVIQVFEAAQ